jgi:hypothetical protein
VNDYSVAILHLEMLAHADSNRYQEFLVGNFICPQALNDQSVEEACEELLNQAFNP